MSNPLRATRRLAYFVMGSVVAAALAGGAAASTGTNVFTYHYDNLRTGWDSTETALTRRNVSGGNFKMLFSVPVDDQVDAQPLVLSNQTISGHGATQYDVVYVATESNSVYAVDAATGDVLRQVNLGTPVPQSGLPGWCGNNGPEVGIDSTPAIDPATRKIYVITDTYEHTHAVYRLHALDPSTLADTITPIVLSASGTLSDGSTYNFDADVSRLRAALLVANGNVYAGFASYCDEAADQSRGWVLGWNLDTLTPLASNELNNTRAKSTDNFFLTSIWMSGYGLAAGINGDIYFVTGNSDYAANSYNPVTNLAESVVQLSPDLTTVNGFFTPMGSSYGWRNLDSWDADFGSGGAMLLPPQTGASTNIAVAAGKVGILYALNADNLNNGKARGGKPLGKYDIGGCWCGPSYYTASDGTGRVVTSGGNGVEVWKVSIRGGKPKLVLQSQPGGVSDGQDPGFFTVISSNGGQKHSAIVWAVSRPVSASNADVSLYAFDPDKGTQLFNAVAGSWHNLGGNSNIVPVVADGHVFVASDESLTIFGIQKGAYRAPTLPVVRHLATRAPLAPGEHEIFGIVRSIRGDDVVIRMRNGRDLTVDTAPAAAKFDKAQPWVGHGMVARGTFADGGMLKASIVQHAKYHPQMWPPDR